MRYRFNGVHRFKGKNGRNYRGTRDSLMRKSEWLFIIQIEIILSEDDSQEISQGITIRQKSGYKCSLTTAPPRFIIYIYMTEQDKNSIGLSFNQRLIKKERKKRDRRQKRTSQQLY